MKNIIDRDILLKDVEEIAYNARKEYKRLTSNSSFGSNRVAYYDSNIVNGINSMQRQFIRALLENDYEDDPSSSSSSKPKWYKEQEKQWVNSSYEDRVSALKMALKYKMPYSPSVSFAQEVIKKAKHELSNVYKNKNNLEKLFDEVTKEDETLFDKKFKVLTYIYLSEEQLFDDKYQSFLSITEHINWHGSKREFSSVWEKVFDDFFLGNDIEKSLEYKNKLIIQSLMYELPTFDQKTQEKFESLWLRGLMSPKDISSLLSKTNPEKLNELIKELGIEDAELDSDYFKSKKLISGQSIIDILLNHQSVKIDKKEIAIKINKNKNPSPVLDKKINF